MLTRGLDRLATGRAGAKNSSGAVRRRKTRGIGPRTSYWIGLPARPGRPGPQKPPTTERAP